MQTLSTKLHASGFRNPTLPMCTCKDGRKCGSGPTNFRAGCESSRSKSRTARAGIHESKEQCGILCKSIAAPAWVETVGLSVSSPFGVACLALAAPAASGSSLLSCLSTLRALAHCSYDAQLARSHGNACHGAPRVLAGRPAASAAQASALSFCLLQGSLLAAPSVWLLPPPNPNQCPRAMFFRKLPETAVLSTSRGSAPSAGIYDPGSGFADPPPPPNGIPLPPPPQPSPSPPAGAGAARPPPRAETINSQRQPILVTVETFHVRVLKKKGSCEQDRVPARPASCGS